jgi:CRISPR/Cas system CSM-associated protein Csm2 small subunit
MQLKNRKVFNNKKNRRDKQAMNKKKSITINNKTINLGYYETPEQASKAYLEKATEIKGEYMRPIPTEGY